MIQCNNCFSEDNLILSSESLEDLLKDHTNRHDKIKSFLNEYDYEHICNNCVKFIVLELKDYLDDSMAPMARCFLEAFSITKGGL